MSETRQRRHPRITSDSPANSLNIELIDLIRQRLLIWSQGNDKVYPWRNPSEDWHGLIAEILLQRTKVTSVIPVYERFLARFTTPQELADASTEEIEQIIYPLGLRWRASLIKELGIYLSQNDTIIPRSLTELKTLPGVGEYVAAAWLSIFGGVRAVIVDANIVRWLCRLINQPYDGETRRKKWLLDMADAFTPDTEWKEYNLAVLDFTMEICTPKPKCERCPLADLCNYGQLRLRDNAPN